jgi:subtilisin family serine protease
LTVAASQPEIFVVTLFKNQDSQRLAQQLSKNMEVVSHDQRSLLVKAFRHQLKSLASQPGVEHIQVAPRFESLHMKSLNQKGLQPLNETTPSGFETGTKVMNFESAWNQGLSGQDQVVAFADTGLDTGDSNSIHPDFKGAVKAGQALGLWGKSWEDPMGHGTHVAGSIAGRGSHSQGSFRGGAYDSMLVAQSMWSPMMNNIMPKEKGRIFILTLGEVPPIWVLTTVLPSKSMSGVLTIKTCF